MELAKDSLWVLNRSLVKWQFLNTLNAFLQMKLSNLKGKKPSGAKEAHTQHTKYGMGDYYGTGFKNPMGKMRSDSMGLKPVSKKQLGTPPKSVV